MCRITTIITLALLCVLAAGCLDDEARGIAWSPNGSAIAWVQSGQIVIQPLGVIATDAPTEITLKPVGDALAWMPDGNGLVTIARNDDDQWQLLQIATDGEQTPLITDPTRIAAPVVDPGGRLVIHADFQWAGADIHGLLEGVQTDLIADPGDEIPLGLSADGRYLLYSSCVAGQTDLWVHDFEIGAGTQLTDDEAIETMARWLSGSRSVVFATQDEARGGVWLTDISDPDPDSLWQDDAIVTDIEWTPSGDEILFCAGGELHRVSDRGRNHRVWPGVGSEIHDISISPDGLQIALAGTGPVTMLGIDWGYPWPLDGDFQSSLDLMSRWAMRVDAESAMAVFGRWLARTDDSERTAQILKQRAEVLIDQGDHERALSTLGLALRAHLPADPELHRMVGEIMHLVRADSPRALITMRNYHSELIARAEPDQIPPAPLALVVLETESEELATVHRQMVNAAEASHWATMVTALGALIDGNDDIKPGALDFGFDQLTPMAMDGDLAALDLGALLLVDEADPDKRWEIQVPMIAALLRSERWPEAPSAMTRVLTEHGSPERIEELIVASAMTVANQALGQSEEPALFGEHSAVRVSQVWRSPALQQVLADIGTAQNRASVEALIALAHFVAGDAPGLDNSLRRVERHRSLESFGDREAEALNCLIHLLRGYQSLRDDDLLGAAEALEAGLSLLETAAPLNAPDDWQEVVATASMMANETLATLEEVGESREASRAMRNDWRLLYLNLLRPPVMVSLPSASVPRRNLPDLVDGTGGLALDLRREFARTTDRTDVPALWGHARIGEATAVLNTGDVTGAISILREVSDEAEMEIHRQTALWHLSHIHAELGDAALAREATERWRSEITSERELAAFERWEDQP